MSNSAKLILGIIVIGVGIVGFILLKSDSSVITTANPLVTPTPTYVPTLQDTENLLLDRSKINFPSISKAEKIEKNNLPADQASLISSGASGVSIEKLTYTGGKMGFRVKYSDSNSLNDAYYGLIRDTARWELLLGSRADRAAMIEREAPNFLVRIILSADSTGTKTFIQTIEK